jgi:PIN domain nuclease of toxin-antitoxin system
LILLDTHVLLWLDSADPQLGAEARDAIDEAHQAGELAVSAISFWETAMLIEKGRLKLDIPAHVWRQDLLSAGLREIAVEPSPEPEIGWHSLSRRPVGSRESPPKMVSWLHKMCSWP